MEATLNQKSIKMIKQILVMRSAGHSISAISRCLNISRNTVKSHLRKHWSNLTDKGPGSSQEARPGWTETVDWAELESLRNCGVSVKQLFSEVNVPVSYEQFSRHLKARSAKPAVEVAPPLKHTLGERTQVDYCDGILILDRKTGKTTKTHFFCGVLPASSKTFGEFVWNQKIPSFIRSHENMWSYFGGVTPYVVIDNLKSGVTKAHRFDPDINPTYCDYGNHAGFGVLPARPRTPRDKAAVEAAIGAIQRDFFQMAKRRIFYSLDDLNRCFRDFLDEFNERIMKDYGLSRNTRFKHERPLLNPLPPSVYEIYEWKEAKVHPDCCIQVAKKFYSVPFSYVGQSVKVKMGDKLITVYSQAMEKIATHAKIFKGTKSLIDDHFPNQSMQLDSYAVSRTRKVASDMGPSVQAYVEWQFDIARPLTALRRMQGVTRLYKSCEYPREAFEYASTQAMQFQKRDLRYFELCVKSFQRVGKPEIISAPKRTADTINLH